MLNRLLSRSTSRALKCHFHSSSSASLIVKQRVALPSLVVLLPTQFTAIATPKPATSAQQFVSIRSFSSDSHDDFSPKRKSVPTETDEAIKMIQEHVKQNKIMLYMKGNPSMPMCGFSARVVQALQKEGVDFASVNVLDYPSIREGIKQFANWPTIPQLYVNGEFVGGCDIVMSMHESGELKELLAETKENPSDTTN